MKLGALKHPKTLDLAARLGIKRPQVIGHLELLWAYVAEFTPAGNVGKYPDGSIAGACDWDGNPTEFVHALTAAGWLDPDPVHRLVVHDWADHVPRFVLAKLSRAKQPLISADPSYRQHYSPNNSQDYSHNYSGDSPPRLATPRHVEGSEDARNSPQSFSQTEKPVGPHNEPVSHPEAFQLAEQAPEKPKVRRSTSTPSPAIPPDQRPSESFSVRPGASKNARGRGSRLPADWPLGELARAFAVGCGVDPDLEHGRFVDYWTARAGAGGLKLDWDATWRNWCRSARDRGGSKPASALAQVRKKWGGQ